MWASALTSSPSAHSIPEQFAAHLGRRSGADRDEETGTGEIVSGTTQTNSEDPQPH